jgi:cold shock CspA family protein
MIGEVTKYVSNRSFGFIRELGDHGTEQFFHIEDVVGRTVLREGDLVSFSIEPSKTKPGKTHAVHVRLQKRDVAAPGSAAEVAQ